MSIFSRQCASNLKILFEVYFLVSYLYTIQRRRFDDSLKSLDEGFKVRPFQVFGISRFGVLANFEIQTTKTNTQVKSG